MQKFSKILMLLVLFVLLPKNVSALLCENAEKVKLQEQAKNISYSYDAIEKNGKVDFTVAFSNGPSDFALKNPKTGKWYYFKNGLITISGLESNTRYRYDVYYIKDTGCESIALFTFNVVLPSFNSYYNDALCEGIEEYALCSKWKNISYTYEEWKQKVILYKESLKPEINEPNTEEEGKKLLEQLIEIYGEIYYILLPGIIVSGIVIIHVYNKKHDLF